MIQLQQMLEATAAFVARHFDVVHLDGRDGDGLRLVGSPEAKLGDGGWKEA